MIYIFSLDKTNSCEVAIVYIGSNKVDDVLDKKIDKNGRILILGVKLHETNFFPSQSLQS